MPLQATALLCPHDETPMTTREVERVSVDACGTCGGTWFDAGELRRVAHDKELEQLALRERRYPQEAQIACPRCGLACEEAWIAEVAVDVCRSCRGVWLDRGELQEAKRQLDVHRILESADGGFRRFLARI